MEQFIKLLQDCGIPSVIIVFALAIFFGAKGLLSVLKAINNGLVDLSTTLKILVEQNANMMKLHEKEIDRLLGMVEHNANR